MAALHAASFDDAWSEQVIADLLRMPGAFALWHESGFILARAAGGEAEILTLAVAPAVRRRGLATELVSAAASHAHRLGAAALFLEVAAGNLAACALYRRQGFVEAGLRKGYYTLAGRKPQDALVLRSNLPLSPLGKSPAAG
ncbi:MAG TPA: GNAT family N-acetyltransferase [Rhizomicrobium sp.]